MKKVVVRILLGVTVAIAVILTVVQMNQEHQAAEQRFHEEKSAIIEEGYWDQADEIQKDLIRMKEMEISITGERYKDGIPTVMDIARYLRDNGTYYQNITVLIPSDSVVHGNIIARFIICESNVTVVGSLNAAAVTLHEGCEVLGDINSHRLTFIGPTDLALKTIKVSGERPENWYAYNSKPEMKTEMYRR